MKGGSVVLAVALVVWLSAGMLVPLGELKPLGSVSGETQGQWWDGFSPLSGPDDRA